jgi:phthiocerol/phenolphthiocerol synthesis type-I polyketide synthase D
VAEGLQALDAVLAAGRASTGVVRLDLDRMTAALPDLVDRPFFGLVLAGRDRDDGNVAGGSDWAGAGALRDADPEQARCLLRERLVFRVAQIAGRRADELDRDVPLATLGLDSLMAVRAKNVVEHDFGANLPVRLLLQGASLADVEEHLVGQLGLRSGRVRVADPPPPAGQRPEPAGAQ